MQGKIETEVVVGVNSVHLFLEYGVRVVGIFGIGLITKQIIEVSFEGAFVFILSCIA